MHLMSDAAKPEGTEKHMPVVEKDGDKVTVKVWSVPHPMTPEHQIEWIEVITAKKIYRKYLEATDTPAAEFEIAEEILTVREYCNLHGLRKA